MLHRPEPVLIDNPGFFVTNVMKDCPAKTVIRELLQNAIEACREAGGGKIEWFAERWRGVTKLGLYNEGQGMSMDELNRRMNIANSGKGLGFDRNFGQGAKMSAGKASPYGLVYRSCKSGLVYEIWLQVRDQPDGGKLLVKVPQYDTYDEEEVVVRQVTDAALDRGRPLSHDWTEAILLGRTEDEDTLTGAFLGESSSLWLTTLIARRYYRFPEGITVQNVSVTSSREPERRSARALAETLALESYTHRQEPVQVQSETLGPITLVYGKLAGHAKHRKSGSWYAAGLSGGTHLCLVYKDEIYHFDQRWGYRAGAFGFSGISEDYYVHVLLDDRAPVMNNNHRTEIVTKDSETAVLTCDDFATMIREHRPAWILDDIQAKMDTDISGNVHERLQKIAEQLRIDVPIATLDPGLGHELGVVEIDRGEEPGGSRSPHPHPQTPQPNGRFSRPGIGRRTNRPRPETLQVYFIDPDTMPGTLEGLVGRAGYYDEGDNHLWLSREFGVYETLKAWVDQEWPTIEEHGVAMSIMDEEYSVFAGSYAIGVLSFRGHESWSPDEWKQGLTQEALSFHMRDPLRHVQNRLRTRLNRRFNRGLRDQSGVLSYAG